MDKLSIFISYSWNHSKKKEYRERVIVLQEKLKSYGFNAIIDRDKSREEDPDSEMKWGRWMIKKIHDADVVISIISENYKHCINSDEKCIGYGGVEWEGENVLEELKNKKTRVEMIALYKDDTQYIPMGFSGYNITAIDDIDSDWEDDGDSCNELLIRLRNIHKKTNCTSSEIVDNAFKKPFKVPFESKEDGAIGIEEKLQEVDKILKETKKTAIGQVATFEGIGGLGKTQLVVEYAHRFKDSFDGVVWLTMDQDIDDQLMDLSDSVGWTEKDIDKQVKLDISYERFRALENTLLIYDNVESYQEIESYIPNATNNFILITSRNVIKGFTSISLAVLSEEHSLELLVSESKREIKDKELSSAKALVKELDGLPLALEMAGAFVCEFELSWDDYLENFLEEGVSFLDESDVVGWTKHESNISKTLHLSEEFLKQNPLLEEVLALIAWGASEPMDKELISQMLGIKQAKLVIALSKGIKLRLIKVEDGDEEQKFYTLHRLVKEVWKKQKKLDQGFTQRISQHLAIYMKDIKDEFLNFHKLDMASFQAKVWADRLEDNAETKAVLMCYAVYPEYYMGEYKKALESVEYAYGIISDNTDSDEYVEILNSKGFLLGASGDEKGAKPYHEEALEMRKRLYPDKDHPGVASSLSNMGGVLNSLGDAKNAKPYYEEALEMRKRLYPDKDHPDVASSLNNMGALLLDFKQCVRAQDYLEQAKEMMMRLGYDGGKLIIIDKHLNNVKQAIKKEKKLKFNKKGRFCKDS